MAGTTVNVRLGYDALDSEVEELRAGLNALIDAMETFRAAMATANGGTIAMAQTSLRQVLAIQERLNNTITPVTALEIAVGGGDAQSGTVGTALSTALTVLVTRGGVAAQGETVTWAASDEGALSSQSITNTLGVASATYTLGTLVGAKTVTATVDGGASVTFTATATAGAATTIEAVSVTDQSALVTATVAAPPSVRVTDTYGNSKDGVTVTFAVTAGSGSRDPGTVDSAADTGIATLTSWTMGAGVGLNTLTATAAGLTGSPVTFNANATAAAATQIAVQSGGAQTGVTAGDAATATVARVEDVGDNAVEGVTVSAVVTTGSGTLDVASAVTDASGDASFTYTTHTTAETATLTFSFVNAAGTTVSVSTTIASTFGTATKLLIVTQPASNGSSGSVLPGQPIVRVTDANDNTVTNSTASITTSIGSGNATITAGGTKACVAGIATFTALTLNDADGGSNTVIFDSGALTEVESTGVTLAPPVPAKLAMFTQPVTVTAGAVLSPAPAVNIQDSSNVSVPGATNAVTVSLGDNGEGATLGGTLTVNAVDSTATFSDLVVTVATGSFTLVFTSTGLTGTTSTAFTVVAAGGGIEPAGLTEIITYVPSSATRVGGPLELPNSYISGNPTNAANYGLSKGKARADTGTTGGIVGTNFRQKWPQGMATGVSPGNNLWFNDDKAGNTDGNHVDSWEEIFEELKIRFYGPPGHEDRWEVLSGTGSAKLLGFHGAAVLGNTSPNQIYILFRALPRSQSPWGPGVYQGQGGSGGYNFYVVQQGGPSQVGAPNGFGGTAAEYPTNHGGLNTNSVVIKPSASKILTIQTYMKMNAMGQDNGVLRMAVDAVTDGAFIQTHEYTNCRFRGTGATRGWFARCFSPTLGGGGPGTKQEDGFMDILSWRIKVKTVID